MQSIVRLALLAIMPLAATAVQAQPTWPAKPVRVRHKSAEGRRRRSPRIVDCR